MVLEWWDNLSSDQKTHICGTTKLIGRTRRHESLTYCQVELLFDAENEFDLETNEKIFNSETQNKGTQRSPFGMWS